MYNKFFNVYEDTKIYILSIRSVTGGPDALHQLAYYLKRLGYNPIMAYLYSTREEAVSAPQEYLCYNTEGIIYDDIEDNKHNIVIIPEPFAQFSKLFRHVQIGIWWLSVDNYFVGEKRNTFSYRLGFAKGHRSIQMLFKYRINNPRVINLAASQYAYDYLESKKIKSHQMVEPLGLTFIKYMNEQLRSSRIKKDVVFYNPKKGKDITQQIIKQCEDIQFIPIENMSYQQVLDTLQTGKVYMDFGEFPGAERLPKEAVVCGCCVLTGTKGASSNDVDVCIPKKYKFEKPLEQIDLIKSTINDFFKNYDLRRKEFEAYIVRVENLEKNFEKAIANIFRKGR